MSLAAPQRPRREEPLRIGLLGAAEIARRRFVPALLRTDCARVVAVASRDPQQGAALAAACGARAQSYEALLENRAVELVYLCLPNHLHEAWTLRALAAGKHVLCEKPLGLSRAAVERMVAVAEGAGLLLEENLMWLHHPQHAVVAGLIRSGEIGRIAALRSVFTIPLPAVGNFRLDPACGGGAFFDLARYPLGTADLLLAGACRSFRGHALWRDGLNLAMHGTALTAAEEIFSFSIAFGSAYACAYEVSGEFGIIRLDRAYTPPADHVGRIELHRDGVVREVRVPPCDQFQTMIEALAVRIRGESAWSDLYGRARRLAALAEAMEKGCGHDC